ncbi:MAG: hypothetical protein CMP11_08385 [Zetaproteobacteria bacterium]|nr:hypothetical protein [Pseudobdellovibrionaceae bacterium]|tara:strand:+ start:1105 stop:1905 length:801 start_codon:yes stop_codon:yes gene_type:complete
MIKRIKRKNHFISLAIFLGLLAPILQGNYIDYTSLDISTFPLESPQKIGFTFVGSILQKASLDGRPNAENVILIKNDETSQLKALKAGMDMLEHPLLAVVDEKFVVIEEKGTELAVAERGFADISTKKKKNRVKKPKKIYSSKFSEEGFSREFEGSSGTIELTSEYRDKILTKDLGTIIMQASAEPIIKNNQVIGFMLDQIDEGSMFEKAGFENRDIITEINGEPLNNAADAIKLLNQVKNMDNVNFKMLKGGINGSEIEVGIGVK